MKDLYERLDDLSLRMDRIVLLAGMLNDGDAIADPLTELLEDEDDEGLQACFPDLPADLLNERDAWDVFREAFTCWAIDNEKLGFAVRFARPAMRWNPEGYSASFSWGRYNTAWLYGDTLEQVVERGEQWAQEREAAEKAKAKGSAAV